MVGRIGFEVSEVCVRLEPVGEGAPLVALPVLPDPESLSATCAAFISIENVPITLCCWNEVSGSPGSETGIVPNAQITPADAELTLSSPPCIQLVAFEIESCAEKVSVVMLPERTETIGPE